jgi:hypothetical protein
MCYFAIQNRCKITSNLILRLSFLLDFFLFFLKEIMFVVYLLFVSV